MKRMVLGVLIAITSMAAITPAMAYDHWHHRYCHRVWHHHHWERVCR